MLGAALRPRAARRLPLALPGETCGSVASRSTARAAKASEGSVSSRVEHSAFLRPPPGLPPSPAAQDCPLDLRAGNGEFAAARRGPLEARLAELAAATGEQIYAQVLRRATKRGCNPCTEAASPRTAPAAQCGPYASPTHLPCGPHASTVYLRASPGARELRGARGHALCWCPLGAVARGGGLSYTHHTITVQGRQRCALRPWPAATLGPRGCIPRRSRRQLCARLQLCASRLQPYAPRLQPYASRLQPFAQQARLAAMAGCLGGSALAAICRAYAEDFQGWCGVA